MPVVDVESFRLRVVVEGQERAALSLDQLRTDYPSSDVVGKAAVSECTVGIAVCECCATLPKFTLEWCLPRVSCKR